MPRAGLRPCSAPGCPNVQPEARCHGHRTERDRQLRTTTPTKATRDWSERQRRAQAVARHRATQGDWCPGWQRPGHKAADLTADHITAVAASGSPTGPLQVLCRECNGRKAASP